MPVVSGQARSLSPWLAFSCIALGGCETRESLPGVPEYTLENPLTLVSQESGLIASPRELALDSQGDLFVLDLIDQRIIRVSQEGQRKADVGRPGEGPGEFSRAFAMGIDVADTIRVFDFGKGVVQVFATDGDYAREYRAELGFPSGIEFGPAGELAYAGASESGQAGLVSVLDSNGGEADVIGTLVSKDTEIPQTLLEQLHQKELPDFMRNRSLPVFDQDGGLWLFLQTEGVLRHFGPDGVLDVEHEVVIPEMTVITDAYYSWYASVEQPDVLRYLDQVEDGAVAGEYLWLLWDMPPGYPTLITVHDGAGRLTARVSVPEVSQVASMGDGSHRPPPLRRIAVDPVRGRLYVLDQETSSLVAFNIPGELQSPSGEA